MSYKANSQMTLQLIISSSPVTDVTKKFAAENRIPIFNQTWVNACLISQRFLPETEEISYVYTIPQPITAYWKLAHYWPLGAQHTCVLEGCCQQKAPVTPRTRRKPPAATERAPASKRKAEKIEEVEEKPTPRGRQTKKTKR